MLSDHQVTFFFFSLSLSRYQALIGASREILIFASQSRASVRPSVCFPSVQSRVCEAAAAAAAAFRKFATFSPLETADSRFRVLSALLFVLARHPRARQTESHDYPSCVTIPIRFSAGRD